MKHKHNPQFNEALPLLRRAAQGGPGHLGVRSELSAADRAVIAEQLAGFGVDSPDYLPRQSEWIDRKAKLFEAGEYPDKGVTVTQDQLTALEGSFDLPVPVLIEHASSPLELGYLTQVKAEGGELFGTVALSREANELIERSGAHALSLGLSEDLGEIREVSLVRRPRVAGARLFRGEGLRFDAPFGGTPEPTWREKYEEVSSRRREEDAERTVEQFMREGRLVPAQAPYAKALLGREDVVEFDGEKRPLRHLLVAMIERSVPHALFSELAPSSAGKETADLAPEEAEFYRKHFPGLSLEEIASRRARHRAG